MIDEPESIDALNHDQVRKEMIWDIYLSGGNVEWFVRQKDQSLENFREFEQVWRETWFARKFLEENTPFWEMQSTLPNPNSTPTPDDDWTSADTLIRGEDTDFGGAEVFFKPGQVYAIYLPDASNDDNPNTMGEFQNNVNGSPELDLRDYAGLEFTGRWYNPRTGEFVGDPFSLLGGKWASLGASPDGFQNTNDWALMVQVVENIPEPMTMILMLPAGCMLLGRHQRPL
ncbi:MAG: hypothetical protein HC898_02100 [Phycisphaerales bacterium]|nr:hypothetical protein [Phycisphaerales bacterium]